MEFVKKYFDDMKNALDGVSKEDVKRIVEILHDAYENEKKIFICGNGGSASTASHFACDMGKGTLKRFYDENEKRFRVVSLTDNVALITAFGNDVSYDDVFAQQLKNLVEPDDVLIAISASGNSPNIVKAVELAKRANAKVIGFTGFNGGKLRELSDYYVHVNSDHYGIVEDIHMVLSHMICSYLGKLKNKDQD